MKHDNRIVIWGAGKIGRGFIGDLAFRSDYEITFVDANKAFVQQLKAQGTYTVQNLRSANEQEKIVIDSFDILHIDEEEHIHHALSSTELMAVVVFPQNFEDIAKKIAEHIEKRKLQEERAPLDILLCANVHHPGPIFSSLIKSNLSASGKVFFEEQVGVIETLVIRMAVQPTDEMVKEDPYVVMTNGYPELTADANSFKGELPKIGGLRYTSKIAAEEKRKMYTYNMVHAVYAYAGAVKDLTMVVDAAEDRDISCIAEGALEEISQAFQNDSSFTKEEMDAWNREVLQNMANPILKDRIDRVGGDPKRKMARTDRLVGPALICRDNGIFPYYLSIAIACGYLFNDPDDAASVEIQDYLKTYSVKNAVERYSGLKTELELIQGIKEQYDRILSQGIGWVADNAQRVSLLKQAYRLGFVNELTIRGCAQCTVKALGELVGEVDDALFKATSGLSGGMAITGDGSCGGYVGGILLMGSYIGRRLSRLDDGDKIAQYASYEMAQKLHDKYIETYGSVTCSDIHMGIFDGRSYCLKTKAVRNEFEEAGAHLDKCTTVIATASMWTAEILMEHGFISMSDIV